ncbi:hypothetical protein FHX37_4193, partial [Haloactinospora alba]
MSVLQITLGLICAAMTVVAIAMLAMTVTRMIRTIRLGRPEPGRGGPLGTRLAVMVKEILGHTRMLKWGTVGVAHWLVMAGFVALMLTVLEAYVEVVNPEFHLPLLGEWAPWNLW